MKRIYKVAQNIFSISVAEPLPAWDALQSRYSPFALTTEDSLQSSTGITPLLEVEIKAGALPVMDAELLYEPEHAVVGLISSKILHGKNGELVIDFRHNFGTEPRVRMIMPPELNRAQVFIDPVDDQEDPYFLTHAVMVAYMIATSGNGTLLFHSSAIMYEGKAYLFQGKSGTGKTTHSRMWLEHIAGAELLNDDNPLVRFSEDGRAVAYGSPWSGKTNCYRNLSAPVGGLVRIVRGERNELRRLDPLKAYASLTVSISFMPFLSDELRTIRHLTIERLVGTVPCYEMYCLPDADAAITCCNQLRQI